MSSFSNKVTVLQLLSTLNASIYYSGGQWIAKMYSIITGGVAYERKKISGIAGAMGAGTNVHITFAEAFVLIPKVVELNVNNAGLATAPVSAPSWDNLSTTGFDLYNTDSVNTLDIGWSVDGVSAS